MTPSRPSGNEAKLRELIVYLSELSEKDAAFGLTKLNKLLFRADFEAFVRWGKPITGVQYFALNEGPAPRAMARLLPIMVSQGDIKIEKQMYQGGKQQRTVRRRHARIGNFTSEERDLVNDLVKQYWGQSGTKMSKESHKFLGWKLANLEQDIPYSVALLSDRKPTQDEIERGLRLEAMAEEALARNAAKTPPDHRGTSI